MLKNDIFKFHTAVLTNYNKCTQLYVQDNANDFKNSKTQQD